MTDTTPYVTELVRRMRLDDQTVRLTAVEDGVATIAWQQEDVPHPLVLRAREADLRAAVQDHGIQCHDLWPDVGTEAAGFNILLVHLFEVVATRDTSAGLRITREGVEWPEDPRP